MKIQELKQFIFNMKIHKAKKSLRQKTTNSFVRAKKALGQNFLKSEVAL